jgi:hypothetical protein
LVERRVEAEVPDPQGAERDDEEPHRRFDAYEQVGAHQRSRDQRHDDKHARVVGERVAYAAVRERDARTRHSAERAGNAGHVA